MQSALSLPVWISGSSKNILRDTQCHAWSNIGVTQSNGHTELSITGGDWPCPGARRTVVNQTGGPSCAPWAVGKTLLLLSHFSCVWLCVIPWTVPCQAPLSTEFSRQEYWSGLPCPPPGESSQPREPAQVSCIPARVSCITDRFFTTEPPGKPKKPLTGANLCASKDLKEHQVLHQWGREGMGWGWRPWQMPGPGRALGHWDEFRFSSNMMVVSRVF